MNRALWYLVYRSFFGQLRNMLLRLKQPKYLLPALFGAVYFSFAITPLLLSEREIPERATRVFLNAGVIYLSCSLGFLWLFNSRRGGMNFTEGEAEVLLSAPLHRYEIINYAVVKGLPATFFSSLLVAVFFARVMGAASVGYMAVTALLIINFLRVWMLLISFLWRAAEGKTYHWPLRILGALPPLCSGLVGLTAFQDMAMPFHEVVLGPVTVPADVSFWLGHQVRAMVASGFAHHLPAALPGWSLLVLGTVVCYAVTLRLQLPFEEFTLEAVRNKSEPPSLLSTKKTTKAVAHSRTWPALKPFGPVWRAYLWKTVIQLLRGRNGRLLGALWGLIVLGWILTLLLGDEALETVFMVLSLPWAVGAALFVPHILNTDIRGELAQLEMVKTLPIHPRTLFATLVGLTSAITVATQVTLGITAVITLFRLGKLTAALWPLVTGAFIAVPTLSITLIIMENCLMLWLPAWFALKRPTRGPSLDFFGRNLISVFARLLGLSLLSMLPAALTVLIGFGGGMLIGLWAWPLGVAAGSILLLVETVLVAGNVAWLYGRLEPESAELN